GLISTVAGTGTQTFSGDGGAATSANLNQPLSAMLDAAGNLYIADYGNSRIRLVTQSTPAAMSLPSTAYGATSAASYQTVQNTGNGTLTIASISSSSGNFTRGGASATCANSSQVLASAAACVL